MEASADLVPLLRLRDVDRPLLRGVGEGRARWYPGAYDGAAHEDAVDVVRLYPVVVLDPNALGLAVVYPDGVAASRESEHPAVVVVGGVYLPLPVRCDVVELKGVCLVALL